MNKLLKSPWLELIVMCGVVILSYIALMLISIGAETPPGGMSLNSISLLTFGFFLLSFAIALIAVMAGIGGGVLFTPLMLAFTPVDSLIVRGTGLIVAMFSGLVSTGPFMKSGLGNLKISMYCCVGYGTGAFIGAQGAIWVSERLGVTGEGFIRIALGIIILLLALYFLLGGVKIEWPQVNRVDSFTKWLKLPQPYYEESLGKVTDYRITRAGLGIIVMIGVGMISGFFGLGAGWAIVPAMNLIMGVPLKVAAACSGILIGMGDCISVWPYILAGAIIPLFVALWLVGQVLGGIIGAQILIRVKASSIRLILIGILLFSSFGLIIKGLITLGYIPRVSGTVYIAVLLLIMAGVALGMTGKFPTHRGQEIRHMEEPKIPLPQIVYGKIVYWLCIIAALICTIGSVLAIAFPDKNLMNPHYLFFSIWEGNNSEAVWQQIAGGFPGGHFWLHNLNTWDGFTQLGLVIGCSSAFLALLGTSIAFLREKPRSYGWALVSLCVALLVLLSALGLYQV